MSTAFGQRGIFIVPHLPWHGTSVFAVSSKGTAYIVALGYWGNPVRLDEIKTFKIDNVKLSLHVPAVSSWMRNSNETSLLVSSFVWIGVRLIFLCASASNNKEIYTCDNVNHTKTGTKLGFQRHKEFPFPITHLLFTISKKLITLLQNLVYIVALCKVHFNYPFWLFQDWKQ